MTGSVRDNGRMAKDQTPKGLTKDAGWEIGVSRTFAVPLDHAWEEREQQRAHWSSVLDQIEKAL
jgi:hypothetical protein